MIGFIERMVENVTFDSRKKRREYNKTYYEKHRQERQAKSALGGPAVEQDKRRLLSVRIPNSMLGRLGKVMIDAQRQGDYVWKNQSALVEDLLMLGLESLQNKGYEVIDEALQYLQAVRASKSISQHRVEAESAFATVQKELLKLDAIGAKDEATHIYWATRASFLKMSVNPWRDWFLRTMEKTFPKLHKTKPSGITVNDVMEDEEERHLARRATDKEEKRVAWIEWSKTHGR